MSQPARVTVSSGVPAHTHAEIKYLVALVAEATRVQLADTEVHVKYSASPRRRYRQMSGHAYYTFDTRPWSEQDPALVSRLNVLPGVRYLVTLTLCAGFEQRYSADVTMNGTHVMHYWRYKTAPYTTLYSWQEEFVYICAHEFQHVSDYQKPRTRKGYARSSEIECEYAAVQATHAYRLLVALERRVGTGVAARNAGPRGRGSRNEL